MADAPSTRQNSATARAARLAEMVAGLTGCEFDGALGAVNAQDDCDDALEVVARAMLHLESAVTEPEEPERFRVAGFLRGDTSVHARARRRTAPPAEADVVFDLRTPIDADHIDLTAHE